MSFPIIYIYFLVRWFHPNMTKSQAHDMLERVPYDGAFLVRPSEIEDYFSISFRYI